MVRFSELVLGWGYSYSVSTVFVRAGILLPAFSM